MKGLTILAHKFDSRDGILEVLRQKVVPVPSGGIEALCSDWKEHHRERPVIKITIEWAPKGPLMVKSSVDGMVVDTLPLVSGSESGFRLALPGSSSKGALRSQAERIVTTLFDPQEETDFLKQVARFPAVTNLFGAPKAPETPGDEEKEWLPGLSALSIDDCFSKEPISDKALQHMLTGGGSGKDLPGWTEALPGHRKSGACEPYLDPAAHAAIDRWTGGASDKALFLALEPWKFSWKELVLTIDPNRLPRDHTGEVESGTETALAAMALLLLTLRDFVRGEVPLGFGTNRGFGAVEVTKLEIQIPEASSCREGFLRNLMTALKGLSAKVADRELNLEGDDAVANLRKAWTKHLKPKPPSEARPQTPPFTGAMA